jgi:CBS domain containing-hemolysin-like protein
MIQLFLYGFGFIIASGFVAMIDAAVLNVSPAEVEVMLKQNAWGAKDLKKLLQHTTRAIIVIVILTSVTNILGPILVGGKATELFGSSAIGIVTAILTFATIIFSEVVPKSLGAHHAPQISRTVAPLLLLLTRILYPLVIALEHLVRLFKSGKRHVGTEEQIRALANIGGGEGHIDADERELIHRAFVLNDRKAQDIMSPVKDIVSVSSTANIRKAAKVVFAHRYSRYPVVGNSLDDIGGYVLSHDILENMAAGKEELSILKIIRDVPKVDAGLKCDELLNVLRKNAEQIAIVEKDGKTVGLVTLEDVLEELVGEIHDEGDVVE